MTDIVAGDVQSLRSAMGGQVVAIGEAGYDELRAECVWNGDIDRRPWIIASCTSAGDVAAAIRFARSSGRELTVRGGGHNFAGTCIADDAVMIDLGPMCQVEVDPGAKRARCGGGTRWAQLDAATQEHGLAAPGGFISHTGVGGLTLGGGLGWLSRKAGLSCDNLVSVEIVTADGEIRRASAEENGELFWAVRGGGGNFGAVTQFEFQLHDEGPLVHLALSFWAMEDGPAAFRSARDLVAGLPDDVAVFMAALNAPPAPFVPEEHHFRPVYAVLMVAHGAPDAQQRAVAELRGAVAPLVAFDSPMPYTALQQMFDESAPWGIRAYEKAVYLHELSDAAIDVIAAHLPRKTSPMTFMPMFVLGGAFAQQPEDATAFGGSRDTRFALNIAAVAPDAESLDADRAWARAFWSDLVPHAEGIGSYVNFMTEFEQDRVVASYGKVKYDRLAQIKATYDPDNVFHFNANIPPAT